MSIRVTKVFCIAMLAVCLLPADASAQFGMFSNASPSISGSGTTTVERPPTAVRMYVELLAKGKTLEEALGKLKDRHEAAVVLLEGLEADKDSIKLSAPSLSNMQMAQKKKMEMMIMQRMGPRGKKVPKGLKAPKTVAVSAKLTASWPLEAKSPAEFLVAAEALKKKINEADIAGRKEAEELSAEEEELAEEMQAMMQDVMDEKVPVGEPQFVYLARISEDDRKTAMAEAFKKAKDNAAQLAQAAGIKLGPLVGISGQGGGSNNINDDSMYGGMGMGYSRQQYIQQLIGVDRMMGMDSRSNEAISTSAGPVKFQFHVQASFAFEKP